MTCGFVRTVGDRWCPPTPVRVCSDTDPVRTEGGVACAASLPSSLLPTWRVRSRRARQDRPITLLTANELRGWAPCVWPGGRPGHHSRIPYSHDE
jgi:hypothetical protein